MKRAALFLVLAWAAPAAAQKASYEYPGAFRLPQYQSNVDHWASVRQAKYEARLTEAGRDELTESQRMQFNAATIAAYNSPIQAYLSAGAVAPASPAPSAPPASAPPPPSAPPATMPPGVKIVAPPATMAYVR